MLKFLNSYGGYPSALYDIGLFMSSTLGDEQVLNEDIKFKLLIG